MLFSFSIYQDKRGAFIEWTTLGLFELTMTRGAQHAIKLQEGMIRDLRERLAKVEPRDLPALALARGTRLERVRVELHVGPSRKKVTGKLPLIVVPRMFNDDARVLTAFHPKRQSEWFPVAESEGLAEQAQVFFASAWKELDEDAVNPLWSEGRDIVRVLSFSATTRTVFSLLPKKVKGIWDDLIEKRPGEETKQPGAMKVLNDVGVNLTARAAEGLFDRAMPRHPYGEHLRQLVCSTPRQSAIVIGDHGVGKTTLLEGAVRDLLEADDYPSHRNLDRAHAVYRISGKRLIAGMSYLGDWEQRVVDLIDDTRGRKVLFLVEDLHLFGRIGRTRDSERNLADVLRGPVARGEIVLYGEATSEGFRKLDEDAPAFAALFARLFVSPADTKESLRMMIHEARVLEADHEVWLEPDALGAVLELASSTASGKAMPGVAIDVLRHVAKAHAGTSDSPEKPTSVTAKDVRMFLASETGLPDVLLEMDSALDPKDVEARLSRAVMGQRDAITAASDVVARVKARLVDARRPYAVYLFTGPTGTGKTELAKALAEFLYGSASRLVRFDMSEYATWDAAARLVGDRYTPEGTLTRAIREVPFSVVLLDEIEKAHPEVHNLLLQLFDEGRLTDATGATASFTHAVIVMTSNLGSRPKPAVGFGDHAAQAPPPVKAVRDFFSPELFNRIDRVVSFGAISRETAHAIARKEMDSLFRRRGVADRNVFVTTQPDVVDKIVRDSFRAEDGARSLKRYLEEAIGSRLVDHLVATPRSAIERIHLSAPSASEGENATLSLHAESLREAESLGVPFELESDMRLEAHALEAKIAKVTTFLDEVAQGPALADIAGVIQGHLGELRQGRTESADVVYELEALRGEVRSLRERLERMAAALKRDDTTALEMRADPFLERSTPDGTVRYRLFTRSAIASTDPRPLRMHLLSALAEATFLQRILGRRNEPGLHSITIAVLRIGVQDREGRLGDVTEGLFEWLARVYADGRGQTVSVAARLPDGRVVDSLDAPGATHVVIEKAGLGVLDYYEHETGSHVRHSMSAAPELVRVEVLPKGALSPRDILVAHAAAKAERARAVAEDRAELPADPDRIFPATRTIHFDPPRTKGRLSPVEIEDYAMGTTLDARVRKLGFAIEQLLQIRMSRESREPREPREKAGL